MFLGRRAKTWTRVTITKVWEGVGDSNSGMRKGVGCASMGPRNFETVTVHSHQYNEDVETGEEETKEEDMKPEDEEEIWGVEVAVG